MSNAKSDAFVFFGASGDLAYKKIFPALQAMVRRGHLDVPIIGVAKSGWDLAALRAHVRDSLEKSIRSPDAIIAAVHRLISRRFIPFSRIAIASADICSSATSPRV